MTESVIWPTISTLRTVERDDEFPRDARSASEPVSAARLACSAGRKPAISAVMTAATTVKSSSRRDMPVSVNATPGRMTACTTRLDHHATPSAASAPAAARTAASVIDCEIRRRRLAPSATRMAMSRCMPMPRASSRLATFAQAIRRTMALTPASHSEIDDMRDGLGPRAAITDAVKTRGACLSTRV